MKTFYMVAFLWLSLFCKLANASDLGKYAIATFRNVYSSANVTTSAWTEVISAMPSDSSELEIFDSSGQTLEVGFGPVGSEVIKIYIFPGGNGRIPLRSTMGVRVAIRAVSADATTGEIDMNFYQ